MKKLLLVFLLSWLMIPSSYSQNIDNASFDSLCVCAIDRIWCWIPSDVFYTINDTAQPHTPNTLFDTLYGDLHMMFSTVGINYDMYDSIHYTNSVKIYTRPNLIYPNGEKFRGFIMNGYHFYTNNEGFMDFKRGGTPFPHRPLAMQGMYKFEDSLSAVFDYGKAKVLLKKYNPILNSIDTIAYAETDTELAATSTWLPFNLPLNYYSAETPDSIVVIFQSSTLNGEPTTLWIDDISFSYVTGVDEIKKEEDFVLYPNPCRDYLFLESYFHGKEYQVFDQYGKLIQSGSVAKKIDLSRLNPGIYFLSIGEQRIVKFVKAE